MLIHFFRLHIAMLTLLGAAMVLLPAPESSRAQAPKQQLKPNAVQKNSARWWLNQAFAEAKLLEDADSQNQLLRLICDSQAMIGDYDGARFTANKIKDVAIRSESLFGLSVFLARNKKIDRAKAIAEKIETQLQKVSSLSAIAGVQVDQGDIKSARESFAQAVDAAKNSTDPLIAARLSQAAAQTGNAQALATTMVALDDQEIQRLLYILAQSQVRWNDIDGALATARQIQDKMNRALAFDAIVAQLLQNKELQSAQSMIRIAESIEFEGRILGAIAVYHVLSERMTQAQEVLAQIRHPGAKDLALSNIALAQLKVKRFDEAIGMVKKMSGAQAKAHVYQQIAHQLINEKRIDLAKAPLALAERFAGEIRDRHTRAGVYAKVGLGRSRIKDTVGSRSTFDLARLAAYGITDHAQKLSAYLLVASEQAETNDRSATEKAFERARTLVLKQEQAENIIHELLQIADAQVKAADLKGVRPTLDLLMRRTGELKDLNARAAAYARITGQALQAGDKVTAQKARDLTFLESKASSATEKARHLTVLASNFPRYGDAQNIIDWLNSHDTPTLRVTVLNAAGRAVHARNTLDKKK